MNLTVSAGIAPNMVGVLDVTSRNLDTSDVADACKGIGIQA
jgi:hypothetical protein